MTLLITVAERDLHCYRRLGSLLEAEEAVRHALFNLSQSTRESRRGASIEQILHRAFPGKQPARAKQRLTYDEPENLFADIREKILSDN